MTTLFIATSAGLAAATDETGAWRCRVILSGVQAQCVAVDPLTPERIYCGTFDDGLKLSRDLGQTWTDAGEGIAHPRVMSVTVSASDRLNGHGAVWAGTEPSAVFRSVDGGQTWTESISLQQIHSKPDWSFPPRPWTSHVRALTSGANDPGLVLAGIELGGVMRSIDGGQTWEDRKEGGQHDVHSLCTHPAAPERIYETAGGGYAESFDLGATWKRFDDGLEHRYLWGLAVDCGNPGTVVISASPGPRQAHDSQSAQAALYRREGQGRWQKITEGLPPEEGTLAYNLTAHPQKASEFYAVTSGGQALRSTDSGKSWEALNLEWPQGFPHGRIYAVVVQ